jgi:tetratricopeptide (TPR) repeat protein
VVGWLWYLGTLVPVIGLVQVGLQARADRYTYVPLIGILLILAWGLGELAARGREAARLASLAATLALVACAVCSGIQVRRWHDSQTLWEYTLSVTPGNAAAHNNLAKVLEEQGKWDEALAHFQAAYDLDRGFILYRHNLAAAHNNLGIVLEEKGALEEARKEYRKAVDIDGTNAGAHTNLGKVLALQGEPAEAIAELRKALQLDPDLALAHYTLAGLLVGNGDLQGAMRHYRDLLRLDDGPLTQRLARRVCQDAANQRPEFLDALARVYAEAGRFPEAAALARKALEVAESRHEASLSEAIRRRLHGYESGRLPPAD